MEHTVNKKNFDSDKAAKEKRLRYIEQDDELESNSRSQAYASKILQQKLHNPRESHVCECFPIHENVRDCRKEADLKSHLAVTAKIILTSPTVVLALGQDRIFHVHEDLLKVHSGFFAERLRLHPDEKLEFPYTRPALYENFIHFMYTGKLIEKTPFPLHEIWELGSALGAPGFRNVVIDAYREYFKSGRLDKFDIRNIYKYSCKGSTLRKLAAHVMNFKATFISHAKGVKQLTGWEDLMQEYPDIAFDMALYADMQWNGSCPWDAQHRLLFTEAVSLWKRPR